MTSAARRNIELYGLILALAILAFGTAITRAAQTGAWSAPRTDLIWLIAVLFIAHLAARLRAPGADPLILPICVFLSALGLLELQALKSPLLLSQQLWVIMGVSASVGVWLIVKEPDKLGEFKYSAGVIGLALLLSPIVFGAVRGGSKSWLVVGGYSFQPSELAKIFLIVFLAAYLAEKKEVLTTGRRRLFGVNWPDTRHFGPLVVTWAISLLILGFERDLGSSLIFFSVFLVMLYCATGRAALVAVGVCLFLVGIFVAYHTFSHVAPRIDVWLKPLPADVGGSSYQVAQSLFALAAGGMSGAGLGAGFLGRQIAMPAVHTDFIFSALGEELGLAGAAAIVLAYMLFLSRGFHIAAGARSDFTKLLAAGLATVTAVQAVVIIGGVIKMLPLTGVTLPFVSYGGSSMISSFVMVGLLLAVSRER